MEIRLAIPLIITALAAPGHAQTTAHDARTWTKLFDGKTLAGWTQLNGTATYRVEHGAIVGRTTEGSPNSFLCTNRDYSDFELEFEVKVDAGLNSGVQIRSRTRGGRTGRVNGPQVEIEASGAHGAESGYIYGEAAGGWMTPHDKLIPHKTFKDGAWNAYRVLAEGPRIRTWINDTPISDLTHMKRYRSHPSGFIGLQVHAVGRGAGPFEVRWRNIRIREIRNAAAGSKQLELPALFSDHMVLQQDAAVPVWGWAAPGSRVTVRCAGQTKQAVAAQDGRWKLSLGKLAAGGPHELVVESGTTIRIKDVLVGEVWLGSGQSNMAFQVRQARDFAKEKAAAVLPQIRMFTVKRKSTRQPVERCAGEWKVCSPETVGVFSATAYFFGRSLYESLKVPVGLINSSWGGTAIEAWTSEDRQAGVAALSSVFEPWNRRKQAWDPEAADAAFQKALARWRKAAAALRAEGKRPRRRPRKPTDPSLNQNHPANLYNGMIAPLIPYAMRGAIWYQGERNARTAKSARLYRKQLPLLVADWRQRWGQGEFPFLWVQLPNFKKRQADAGAQSAWAVMRDSMFECLKVPHTGMAVTIDVGEANNIHPKNKQAVGDRLARWALAEAYGKDTPASGPLLERARSDGNKVVVTFRHTDGGLKTADGRPLRGFAIRGRDKTWHWANAVIRNGRVIVSHGGVAAPKAVRYAWADNPDCNLINGAGLPASPFEANAKPAGR